MRSISPPGPLPCPPPALPDPAGFGSGAGNASRAWDEFKPFKRENKRTRARDASAAAYGGSSATATSSSSTGSVGSLEEGGSSGGSSDDTNGSGSAFGAQWAGMPEAGAVVEYPLPQVVIDELLDGRSHGVGLLVGRNLDRCGGLCGGGWWGGGRGGRGERLAAVLLPAEGRQGCMPCPPRTPLSGAECVG